MYYANIYNVMIGNKKSKVYWDALLTKISPEVFSIQCSFIKTKVTLMVDLVCKRPIINVTI